MIFKLIFLPLKVTFWIFIILFKVTFYFLKLIFYVILGLLGLIFPSFNPFGNINVNKELINIDNLANGWEFENYIANLLTQNGYSNVKVTSGSGDFGVDVLASKSGVRYAIQCKLYSKPVGNKAVQEVVSGKIYYNCDKAIVVTNNHFTSSAKKLANSTQVELWDREELYNLISRANKDLFNFSKTLKSTYEDEVNQVNYSFEIDDEYLLEAIEITLNEPYISVSMLQRKLKIGFNRASSLINKMTDLDLISPHRDHKTKHLVLISKNEFIAKYQKSVK